MTIKDKVINRLFLLRPLSFASKKCLAACFVVTALSACSESELILEGKRVSVIAANEMIAVDQAAAAEGAGLP